MQSTPLTIAPPFATVTWSRAGEEQFVRLAFIARLRENGGELEPVELPRFTQGTRWVAALVDSENRAIEWLECWVQTTHGLANTPTAKCGLLTNYTLDQSWNQALTAMRGLNPAAVFATPPAARAGEALVIDSNSLSLTRLVHRASRKPWILCRDDAALKSAGKSAYSTSLDRWFQSSGANGESVWIEQRALLETGHPDAIDVIPEAGEATRTIPFNVSAGQMAFWKLSPLDLEAFADALRSGITTTVDSPAGNRSEPAATTPIEELSRTIVAGTRVSPFVAPGLFGEASALEALFLRVALWNSVVSEVYQAAQSSGSPFFNLSSDSFRVELFPAGSLIPSAWSFRTALVKPGQSVAYSISGDKDDLRFVPQGDILQSTAAIRFGGSASSQGTVRFSQVTEGGPGQVKVEGMLDAAALRDSGENALVSVQLTLEGQTVSFVAAIEAEPGGARAGTRFKATIENVSAPVLKQLKSTATPRRNCHVSVVQSVSPALDVYCLGLVGIRILLARESAKVGEIEDDFFELSALLPRDSGVNHLRYLASGTDASERIRRLLDPQEWNASTAGAEGITPEVWFGIVHELLEFVAVEDASEVDKSAVSSDPIWLQPLARRYRSLQALALHLRGLISAPQPAHEEISQLVSRFVDTR